MNKPTDILFDIDTRLERLAEEAAQDQSCTPDAVERIHQHYQERFAEWIVERFKKDHEDLFG